MSSTYRDLLERVVSDMGGAPREGQLVMAEGVAQALAGREHLVVQAGTGTGKSLAYLAPAVSHALGERQRIVISTATLALQHQLLSKDIPRIEAASRSVLGRAPTVCVVKGRSNYVCVHKTGGGYPQDSDTLFGADALPGRAVTTSPLGEQVLRAREFAQHTTTGDRDDMAAGVSNAAWRHVSVSARECLGQTACPVADACHVERARAEASEADIIITNHAMLAIDAFEGRHILPEHECLIIDEAHELTDRVTSVASGALSAESMRVVVAALRGTNADHADVRDHVEAAEDALRSLTEGRLRGGVPADTSAALGALAASLRQAAKDCASSSGEEAGAQAVGKAAATDMFQLIDRLLAGDPYDVLWAARDFRAEPTDPAALHVAPLWVNGLLATHVFAERTVVLTSATLTIGGNFDQVARKWGLPAEPDASRPELAWTSLDVGSPFDYEKQGILYVARELPAPNTPNAADAMVAHLAELINANRGATLGLFSSRVAAERAAEALRETLDVPVLCQGDKPTPELVAEFAADRATCLVGTLSLWQGVDVPGQACSLVAIDRLPFPRPDDPLASARTEAIGRSGGNGFMSVSAQHAALLLAQGVGRLIRSVDDRGVVAVLDSRLATARYGAYIASALPPLWRTTDRGKVTAALARLAAASGT